MENKIQTAAALRRALGKKDAESVKAAASAKTYSARQLIASVLDEGTFAEIGAFVKRAPESEEFEGVICGYGAIDSRLVFIFAQDFYRMKGAFDDVQAKKICSLYELAIKNGAPVIGIFNSAGAVISEGVDALGAYGRVMNSVSKASGVIPQVAYVDGICAGSAAVIASMFDITVCVKDKSSVYVNPPTLLGGKNGSSEYASASGLVSKVYATEAEALGGIRNIVNYLPQNNMEGTVNEILTDDLNRLVDVSYVTGGDYDVKNVISAVADNASFVELSEEYAPEAVCALATIGGSVTGVVANQPKVNGGRLTPFGARKIAKFVSMCDSFAIPVLTFVDSEGFAIGEEYERMPFAAELSKLAYAYSTATTAKITVVLGNAFGGAFTLMGSKSLGADVAIALDSAKISIMSPRSAVAFLCNEKVAKKTREEVEANWAAENAAPVKAAVHGEIDDIIESAELRQRICAAISMLASKCGSVPERRHPNMPL
ncbi:MAG: hypothetical protein E7598_04125 [Ruminococcaceae bacterium]|nr:hypothetical protein [Oscillospiraceae bacterium]